jgi:hypothetical protein
MANALNRSPAKRRIDIYDPDEVSFWCREFDVMPVDLISVVVTVGPRVDDVRRELGRSDALS